MALLRLALYVIGLALVVTAAWLFTAGVPRADELSAKIALALMLLLVGIGIMASVRAFEEPVSRADPITKRRHSRVR